jgi:hypothetical protein
MSLKVYMQSGMSPAYSNQDVGSERVKTNDQKPSHYNITQNNKLYYHLIKGNNEELSYTAENILKASEKTHKAFKAQRTGEGNIGDFWYFGFSMEEVLDMREM